MKLITHALRQMEPINAELGILAGQGSILVAEQKGIRQLSRDLHDEAWAVPPPGIVSLHRNHGLVAAVTMDALWYSRFPAPFEQVPSPVWGEEVDQPCIDDLKRIWFAGRGPSIARFNTTTGRIEKTFNLDRDWAGGSFQLYAGPNCVVIAVPMDHKIAIVSNTDDVLHVVDDADSYVVGVVGGAIATYHDGVTRLRNPATWEIERAIASSDYPVSIVSCATHMLLATMRSIYCVGENELEAVEVPRLGSGKLLRMEAVDGDHVAIVTSDARVAVCRVEP